MSVNDAELKRRLAIAFNDKLSETDRLKFIREGSDLRDISEIHSAFRDVRKECDCILRWLDESSDNHLIWKWDNVFPSFEGMTQRVPIVLLVRGAIPQRDKTRFGIVGTRRPEYLGLQKAFALGFECSSNGVDVVSGFAEGVDQASMRGSLCGRGNCIAVLACGMNIEYPSLTHELRERIVAKGGCLVSRFLPNEKPYKFNIVSRNMVIASYCDALIPVQAPRKSGTLVTCDYALAMGKNLYVLDCGIGEGLAREGTNQLFIDGTEEISSICDINGMNCNRRVVEVMEGKPKSVRFGDRYYMVTEQ